MQQRVMRILGCCARLSERVQPLAGYRGGRDVAVVYAELQLLELV